MSVKSSHEYGCEELKNDLLAEFHRIQKSAHQLINHLTAISGYVQIVQNQPERSIVELDKVASIVEKSTATLRGCLASLKEMERRYS